MFTSAYYGTDHGCINPTVLETSQEQETVPIVLDYISRIINIIKSDFEVDEYEDDGEDEHGPRQWVTCKGGWSGRSWDLDEALNYQLRIKIIKLIHSGININSKFYYIDPTTYFQDWNSQCDITIKLVSEEQHNSFSSNITKLKDIRSKLVKIARKSIEKSTKTIYSMTDILYYQQTRKLENYLEQVLLTGPTDFMESIKFLDEQFTGVKGSYHTNEYNLIHDCIKKLKYDNKLFLGIYY
jgi:hypothetical protein